MKKILVMCLLGCMMLTSVACGNTNEESAQGQDTVTSSVDNESNIVTELSMEVLENAEETPAEEFDYFIYEGEVVITRYKGESEIVVIPDEIEGCPVVEVGRGAFLNNFDIKAVRIGNNVKVLGYETFANCFSLQYVIFGDNVEEVGSDCFTQASEMVEIRLNEGLLKIGDTGFFIPQPVVPIIVPKSVVEIGEAAFPTGVQVYAGTYAEEYIINYAENYGGEFHYEVIE